MLRQQPRGVSFFLPLVAGFTKKIMSSGRRRIPKPVTNRGVRDRVSTLGGLNLGVNGILIGFAIGIIIPSWLIYCNTNNVLEWKKDSKCDPKNNDGCWQGIRHNIHGCECSRRENGHACNTTCFRPENVTISGMETHQCMTTIEDCGKSKRTQCMGSSCFGTCNHVNDCPELTDITSDFLGESEFNGFSFGFNVTCELSMCIYEFDVALFPGFANTTSGCTNDPLYHKQCKGLIGPDEPFRECLDSTAVCRAGGQDADDTFQIDACYFSFKCAGAPGLPQFNQQGPFFRKKKLVRAAFQ